MKIAIIGEYNHQFKPHLATNEAVEHCKQLLKYSFETNWISTEYIENNLIEIVSKYNGFWIAPGSPYKSMKGALNLIKYTRINKLPTIGTCGGFQHMVIEFARNVLGIAEAEHGEYDPYASKMIVNPLSCDLKGEALEILITDDLSKVYNIYEKKTIKEKYYCNFGLNPAYHEMFHTNGFRIVGSDKLQEARILELKDHPFFISTLFVPQDNSSFEQPHKLIQAFIKCTRENLTLQASIS